MQAAGLALKPPSLPAAFTADDMRDEWLQYWAPEHVQAGLAEAWQQMDEEAGLKKSPPRKWQPPSFEEFQNAIKKMKRRKRLRRLGDPGAQGNLQQC